MRKWHLETRDIDDLEEHPRNPRYITKEDAKHLQLSIAKFGLIDKPIITSDGQIIGGHQRLRVLKQLGHYEVECWVCDDDVPFTEEEIDELNIRLNKNTGSWDWDKLANEWDVNLLCEWGFKPDDFDDPLPRSKKPKIILEFVDSEALDMAMKLVEDLAMYSGDKVKIKVKK